LVFLQADETLTFSLSLSLSQPVLNASRFTLLLQPKRCRRFQIRYGNTNRPGRLTGEKVDRKHLTFCALGVVVVGMETSHARVLYPKKVKKISSSIRQPCSTAKEMFLGSQSGWLIQTRTGGRGTCQAYPQVGMAYNEGDCLMQEIWCSL
jgi:hypothetical protein